MVQLLDENLFQILYVPIDTRQANNLQFVC